MMVAEQVIGLKMLALFAGQARPKGFSRQSSLLQDEAEGQSVSQIPRVLKSSLLLSTDTLFSLHGPRWIQIAPVSSLHGPR